MKGKKSKSGAKGWGDKDRSVRTHGGGSSKPVKGKGPK